MSDEILRHCYRQFLATSDPEWAMRFMRNYMRQIGDVGLSEPEKVWAVYIRHKHEEGINVFLTEEGADNYLYNWVSEWWSDVAGQDDDESTLPIPDSPPADKDEAIRMYFAFQQKLSNGEEYHIEVTELLD